MGSLIGIWVPEGSGLHALSGMEGSERSRAQQNNAEEDLLLQIISSDRVPLALKAPAMGTPSSIFSILIS